jgi:hypothetical protein
MSKTILVLWAFVSLLTIIPGFSRERVTFHHDQTARKVEVGVGGTLFPCFIYPENLEKQCLYPILTPSGKFVTRGYPLDNRPFERVDHPHHVGLWFNFGDVNKLDFWNNSFAIKPADKPRYGTILFRGLYALDESRGRLAFLTDWVDVQGKVLMKEEAQYLFAGEGNIRSIERITVLKAVEKVTLTESKEGMLGLRVDRAFEEPLTAPELLLDASGREMTEKTLNNEGVNGVYRNAEGVSGAAVWGTRSPWVALRAVKEGEVITIVIMDHPGNPNYPGWYHARGYGLFSVNNLGGRGFDRNAPEVKVELLPGQSISFRHKVLIAGDMDDAQINQWVKRFQ